MIISKANKKAFIHIPKTGGTSITKYLREVWPDATTSWNMHSTFAEHPIPEDYETYTIVRNPWDWVVSFYAGLYKSYSKESFEYFIQHPLHIKHLVIHFKPQSDYIGPNTHIGRFENLQGYVRYFFNSDVPFYHLNKSDHDFYQDYYTDETRKIVGHMFRMDIATFGYSF